MSTKTFTTVTCDICKRSINIVPDEKVTFRNHSGSERTDKWIDADSRTYITAWDHISLTAVFHADQTEGRPCEPYFDSVSVDVCPECKKKLLEVWPVLGGMGNIELKNVKP